MKKYLCLLMALVMVLTLAVGCGNDPADSSAPSTPDTTVTDDSGNVVTTTTEADATVTDASGNVITTTAGPTTTVTDAHGNVITTTTVKGATTKTTAKPTTAKPTEPHTPTIKKLRVQVDGRTVGANNTIAKWLKKGLGFSIELVHIGTASLTEQLGLMAAADNLPDVFTIRSDISPIYYSLRDSGQLLDIEKILNDWGPNLIAARGQEQINSMRDPDGKLRSVANCTEGSYDVMMIRKDWLDKLNLKVPTTTEELRKVMTAFVKQDPDGNGQDDTYGFLSLRGGARGMLTLFAAFGANPGDCWNVVNGKVQYSFLRTDRMIPAVKYIRSLYEQGLLGEGAEFQMAGTEYNSVVSNGKVGIVQDEVWYLNPSTSWFYADPTAEWIYIDPIKGPDGYSGYVNWQNPHYRGRTCIAANCKDPIAAMQYLNFIADYDNLVTIRTGIEGKHWTYDPSTYNGIAPLEPYTTDTKLIEDGVTATYALPFLAVDPPLDYIWPDCVTALNRRRELEKQWNGVLYDYPEELIKRDDLSLEYTWYAWWQIQVMIKESEDVDADYAKLVADLKDTYKIDEITKIYQRAYDAGQR